MLEKFPSHSWLGKFSSIHDLVSKILCCHFLITGLVHCTYVYHSYYVLTWTISQITLTCIRPTTLPSTIFSGGLNSSCLLSISTSFAAGTPVRPFTVYFSSVYLSSPQAVPSTSTFSLVITTFFGVSTTKWFDTS